MMSEKAEGNDFFKRALEKSRDAEARRQLLVCIPDVDRGEPAAGVRLCESKGAYRTCEWAQPEVLHAVEICPRARALQAWDDLHTRLVAAKVPTRERELVSEDVRISTRDGGRHPLLETAALGAVRKLIAGELVKSIMVLGGPNGAGKTVAACWAIGQRGGLYTVANEFRPGFDIEGAKSAPVLVIDQLGREHRGESDYGKSMFEEVIDHRYAEKRPTILCANIDKEAFADRYDLVVEDRLNGDGIFIELSGASLRSPKEG